MALSFTACILFLATDTTFSHCRCQHCLDRQTSLKGGILDGVSKGFQKGFQKGDIHIHIHVAEILWSLLRHHWLGRAALFVGALYTHGKETKGGVVPPDSRSTWRIGSPTVDVEMIPF